eukprot:Nk52_evm1s2141 gene=Nk52_evmTU1s2141
MKKRRDESSSGESNVCNMFNNAQERIRRGQNSAKHGSCTVKKVEFSGNTDLKNEDPFFSIAGLCQVSNQIFVNGLVEQFYLNTEKELPIHELAKTISYDK